jgi:hypothetical protein
MDSSSEKGVIDPKTITVGKASGTVGATVGEQENQSLVAITAGNVGVTEAPCDLTPEVQNGTDGQPTSLLPSDAPILSIEWAGELVKDQQSNLYAVVRGAGNPCVYRLRGKEMRALIGELLRKSGDRPTKRAVDDVLDELQAKAERTAKSAGVWVRVAPLPDYGCVIALYDDANTQVKITAAGVEVLECGSDVLFYRPATSAPMAYPAEVGDYKLLKKYVNISDESFLLYLAFVTYTLAHAKEVGVVFVFLYLIGGQGAGKSALTKATMRVIDPSVVGVQRLPKQIKDLAIASQTAHVLPFDNLRELKPEMSDVMCTMSTRGATTARRLYTDDELHVVLLHGVLILNGIFSFVDQPDLAQRCLPIRMYSMDESKRKSEAQMWKEFEVDLPVIQRGLFDLMAKIFAVLPNVVPTMPQRMYDFSHWLAAMEVVHQVPSTVYQASYATALNEGQLDSLRENVVGSAILDFAASLKTGEWSGTPAKLLEELDQFMRYSEPSGPHAPRGWPDNPIALSKRLLPLETALRTQDVVLRFERRKEREITINYTGKGVPDERY